MRERLFLPSSNATQGGVNYRLVFVSCSLPSAFRFPLVDRDYYRSSSSRREPSRSGGRRRLNAKRERERCRRGLVQLTIEREREREGKNDFQIKSSEMKNSTVFETRLTIDTLLFHAPRGFRTLLVFNEARVR